MTKFRTEKQNENLMRLGGFETKKIVREFTDLSLTDEFGPTIGQSLDDHLRDCAKNGTEVQSVTLHITEEAWPELAKRLYDEEKSYPA